MIGILTLAFVALAVILLVIGLLRRPRVELDHTALRDELDRLGQRLREEGATQRREAEEGARALREELGRMVQELGRTLREPISALGEIQQRQLTDFGTSLEQLRVTLSDQAGAQRKEQADRLDTLRQELAGQLTLIRTGVAEQLDKLRELNETKLEEMRRTVDEKLHDTLEKRLGESFRQVSERLEQVQQGLGEMRGLAAGVGDLKKVLQNVKTRGTWGEVQLGSLLEQMLTPDQYQRQYKPRPRSAEVVEFAVRLPGRGEGDDPVFLPIDAKFPKEDYERLVDASEQGDVAGVEAAVRQLEQRIRQEARGMRDKYIVPPQTTDFAILYLPTEGLYAEVLRRPGLADQVQRESRVMIAGPTTLAALLNSLQMGFRTLAIEKRSSEVWRMLAVVKRKFEGFRDTLEKAQKKIGEAGKVLADAQDDTRIMGDKLRKVEALPGAESRPTQEWIEGQETSREADDEV
ncbi:MAG: DNA recombination protein RmuC [bacterium]|nr:DNA recombination protein RmuC [bacterium]